MIIKPKLALFLVVWISFTLSASAVERHNTSTPNSAGVATLAGPIPFQVERVIDGDTYDGWADTWLDQTNRVRVRLRGIDTPELRGACAHEKRLGKQAKEFVDEWLHRHKTALINIKKGKYYRVVADIRASNGDLLSQALMQAGLGRPYTGGKRLSWCAT